MDKVLVKNRPKPKDDIEPSDSSTGGGRPSDGMEIDVGPVFGECEDSVNITGNEPGPSTSHQEVGLGLIGPDKARHRLPVKSKVYKFNAAWLKDPIYILGGYKTS